MKREGIITDIKLSQEEVVKGRSIAREITQKGRGWKQRISLTVSVLFGYANCGRSRAVRPESGKTR